MYRFEKLLPNYYDTLSEVVISLITGLEITTLTVSTHKYSESVSLYHDKESS